MDGIQWRVREFITVSTTRIQANKMLHPDDTMVEQENKKPERVGCPGGKTETTQETAGETDGWNSSGHGQEEKRSWQFWRVKAWITVTLRELSGG